MRGDTGSMNLLCIDQYSDLGGAQRTLLDLLPSFAQRGWNIRVAASGDGPLLEAIQKLGYGAHRLHQSRYTKVRKTSSELMKYGWELPNLALALDRLVRKHKVQFLYVNGPRMLAPAACVARHRRIPLLFHCHNRLHQQSATRVAGHSLQFGRAHVVACCRYAGEPLQSYVKPERFQVLYNGIAQTASNPLQREQPIKHVAVVGRIEEEKGQLEFVRAAHILFQRFPNVRFSIIGAPLFSSGAYLEQVKQLAANLPIAFPGWQDNLNDVFGSLDVMVVPSTFHDATPRVVIEALGAGVPVVAFSAGGIPEIIRDEETGFLVKKRTPEELAACVEQVLRMPSEQLRSLRTRAHAAWEEKYRLDNFQGAMCDAIQQIRVAA